MTSLSDLCHNECEKNENKVVFEKFLKKLNFLVDSFLF